MSYQAAEIFVFLIMKPGFHYKTKLKVILFK